MAIPVTPALTWSNLIDTASSMSVITLIVVVFLATAFILLARTAIRVGTAFEGEVGNRAFGVRVRIGAPPSGQAATNPGHSENHELEVSNCADAQFERPP